VAALVVVFPVFALLFLIGVQFALTYYARHVLIAAAQDAATDAARYGAPPATAAQTAADDLAGTHRLLSGLTVAPVDDGATVTVTVSARVESVLRFLEPTVTVRASAPTERFIPEAGR
jgi:hypothetical protein